MPVKEPPAYTVDPLTASAKTTPFALGFHGATEPSPSTWAIPERGSPPTPVKLPPIYQPPDASGMAAKTPPPATLATAATAPPEPESTGTPEPVARPTWVNVPPI